MNEIFNQEEKALDESTQRLNVSQARINMGVFGDFNVSITENIKSQDPLM